MAKLFVVRKIHVYGAFVLFLVLAAWFLSGFFSGEKSEPAASSKAKETVIEMAVVEYKFQMENGREVEAYRWDPGFISVRQGERVRLKILGVNHSTHPFQIEGTDVKGTVKPGEVSTVSFKADEPGLYKLVCLTHRDVNHEGPMIGYIRVLRN